MPRGGTHPRLPADQENGKLPLVMAKHTRTYAAPQRRRRFTDDLRASLIDAAAALALAGITYAIEIARLRAGTNAAAIEMPEMVRNGGVWAYTISQALGWSALVWSWLTMMLGLALPILARGPLGTAWRAATEHLHRAMSLTLVGLMLGHALALLWDRMGDTLAGIFIPYATAYVPGRFAQSLGIVSLYLAVLLGPSFYLRDRLGRAAWRALHRTLVPAVYILAMWHTLAYGSDVKAHDPFWFSIVLAQIPVAFAFAYRFWRA